MNIYRIRITALRTDGLVHSFFEDVVTDTPEAAMELVKHYETTLPTPVSIKFMHFDSAPYNFGKDPEWTKELDDLEYVSHPSFDVCSIRAKNLGYEILQSSEGVFMFSTRKAKA